MGLGKFIKWAFAELYNILGSSFIKYTLMWPRAQVSICVKVLLELL